MWDSDETPTATEIVRSMKRLGFSYEEIYDTLTGTGIPGGEVQLLIDRIETDFEDAEVESRKSRIATEVEDILERKLEKKKTKIESKLRTINREMKSMNGEVNTIKKWIEELRGIVSDIIEVR